MGVIRWRRGGGRPRRTGRRGGAAAFAGAAGGGGAAGRGGFGGLLGGLARGGLAAGGVRGGAGAGGAPGVGGAEVDGRGGAGGDGSRDVGGERDGDGVPALAVGGAAAGALLVDPFGVVGLLDQRPAVGGQRGALRVGGGGGLVGLVGALGGVALGAAPFAQVLGGGLGLAAVHRVDEAAAFLAAQVGDVGAEQDRGDGGGPEEGEAADGGGDRAEGEGEEEQHRGAAAAREDFGAAGARGVAGRGGAAGGGLLRFGALLLRFRLGRPGRGAARRRGFLAHRGHGEGPDVDRTGRGVRGAGRAVGRFTLAGGLAGAGGGLGGLLGVAPLHSRASGQEPDGGAEAFRRPNFVQLVLPAEPHGHQVGGPGPHDDCVNEAAAAHNSHGRGVSLGPSANWAGVSHDPADISRVFPTDVTERLRSATAG